MGGSLPAIARWLETTRQGESRVGLLYSANIGGAVFGCLIAGFYLLRVYDMAIATELPNHNPPRKTARMIENV
jgi:spermidine synthase